MVDYDSRGVLLIYTGGTIGSVPKDKTDPKSPLVPGDIFDALAYLPNYDHSRSELILDGVAIRLSTHSLNRPIDSTEIKPADWKDITITIAQDYADFAGFVIIHGTDTMSYTTSALAFMLEYLGKPVVVTGSQRSASRTRSDGIQNIVSSIEIAAAELLGRQPIPEVVAVFNNKVFRGCRLRKVSASAYDGFSTPNFPELGDLGEHVEINESLVGERPEVSLSTFTDLETRVLPIDVAPGMTNSILKTVLNAPHIDHQASHSNTDNAPALKGLVLKTFGAGNMPSVLVPSIAEAVSRGQSIINVTQCMQGEVEQGLYDVSSGLLSCGVVSGLDMTPEAALLKLMVVLGKLKGDQNRNDIEDAMQLNLRGEQRISVYNLRFTGPNADGQTGRTRILRKSTAKFTHDGRVFTGERDFACPSPRETECIYLHIVGLRVPWVDGNQPEEYDEGIVKFNMFLDIDATQDAPEDREEFLGCVEKDIDYKDLNVVIDITAITARRVKVGRPTSITIVPLRGSSEFELDRVRIVLHSDNWPN